MSPRLTCACSYSGEVSVECVEQWVSASITLVLQLNA